MADRGSKYPAKVPGFEDVIGNSDSLRAAVERAHYFAKRMFNVLLLGETGVGKELFAHAIHKASGRDGEFVDVNCAAIPLELFESEFFGYEKGSFTGAVTDRRGYFDEANKGTLFLDEIGETAVAHQPKLLRVLESSQKGEPPTKRHFKRVGESSTIIHVDVRIVAATNRNLLDRDEKVPFRHDLYQRLSTFSIEIPPLRERSGDIRLLAEKFVHQINDLYSKDDPHYECKELSAAAIDRLEQHHWPGNVRELKDVLRGTLATARNPEIGVAEIEREIAPVKTDEGVDLSKIMHKPGFTLSDYLHTTHKNFIKIALKESARNGSEAAKLLGLPYQTFISQKKSMGL